MIERTYPVVFLTEMSYGIAPIGGVPTSDTPAAFATASVAASAPDWAPHDSSDPRGATLRLQSWLAAAPLPCQAIAAVAHPGYGVAQGLAVDAADSGSGAAVKVSRGLALTAQGRPVGADSRRDSEHIRKP